MNQPQLLVVQAMWGMTDLPSKSTSWDYEKKLELIAEAGFDGVDLDVPYVIGKEAYWQKLLQKNKLILGLQGPYVHSIEDLKKCAGVVKELGAPYLDAQVGNYFTRRDEGLELLRSLVEASEQDKISLRIQTHRGTLTQDLLTTVSYCKEISDINLNLDLSHYFVGCEFGRPEITEEACGELDVLLRKTSMIDGRVSNGQQVQIDIGASGESKFLVPFARLWKKAMCLWLQSARLGAVFVFRPELGPPPYSIVGLDKNEISDRWEQAKIFADIGRRLWNEAVQETGKGKLCHGVLSKKACAKHNGMD